jgi:hypothetical protein
MRIRFAAGVACAALSIGHAQSSGLRHGARIVPVAMGRTDGTVGLPTMTPEVPQAFRAISCKPPANAFAQDPTLALRLVMPETETLFDR